MIYHVFTPKTVWLQQQIHRFITFKLQSAHTRSPVAISFLYLSREDIALTKPIPVFDAIQFLTGENIDMMLPQMFCIPGMTQYRALFDLLKIPYIGNTPDIMAIAAHKARAKAIVEAAGVKVPRGNASPRRRSDNYTPSSRQTRKF